MSIPVILPLDRETVTHLSASRNEPEWLAALRLEALDQAASLDLPVLEKTRIDRWDLEHYGKIKRSEPVTSADALPEAVQELLQRSGNVIVQHNSDVVYTQLSDELAAKGVIFMSLSQAAEKHPELVKPYLMQALRHDENRVTALHAAIWTGGVFLHVPKNVEVDTPLQAVFYNDDAEAVFAPHVLIVVNQHSRVTLVEHRLAEGDAPITHNGAVEVYAKPGAHVRFATVHDMRGPVTDLSYRRAVIENDARVEWIAGEMNEGNTMTDTTSIMRGHGSSSNAQAILVGAESQNMNITTRAVHQGKNTDSAMTTRAVMLDRSTAILNGVTKMDKGATKANGEQTEKVLMLSPQARGDANPILLIDEDDVKAGHAASVGQVNPEHIHYLMSRGIPRPEAERLIIYGFLAPIIAELPIEGIRERLQQLVERKLD